jgi:hypothetical protein
MTKHSQTRAQLWLALAGAVWLAAACAGLLFVWRYKTTPGPAAGDAPKEFPSDIAKAAGLVPEAGLPTVIMLAHPKCPCTRASISELHVLFTQLGGRARGFVLFMSPHDMPDGWEKSDTWRRAEEIRGVTVLRDGDGQLAARFGARVSGHTVVYDAGGHLVFSGGMTSARGHSGDNAGRSAIVHFLGGQASSAPASGVGPLARTPTFGCGLQQEESTP